MRQRNHSPFLAMSNWNHPDTRTISRGAALKAVGAVVYAVRVRDLVKIGHTADLANRVSGLHATEVLAFRPGTRDDEQAIHAQLVDHLAHGREYYRPTPEVMAVVNDMRERIGLEPVA